MSSRSAKSLVLGIFIWAVSLSYAFPDWITYRRKLLAQPGAWKMYLHGGIEAPWQYRIGPWLVADWTERWFHWKPYDTLTLVDVLCLACAMWIMLRMLRRAERYRALSSSMRWLPLAAALFLVEYYIAWGHWYQTCVTIPSILFVAASMALIDGKAVRNRLTATLLLLGIAGLQGFVRADVAVVMHAGFFLAVVFDPRCHPPLGRLGQALTSVAAAALAGCVQLYLMLVKFPHAPYASGGVWRLSTNIHPGMWLTMLLALVPYWLLLAVIAKKRYHVHGTETLLLTASLLYLAVWAAVGLIDEVRIFLPFAFALIPTTVLAFTGVVVESQDARSVHAHS